MHGFTKLIVFLFFSNVASAEQRDFWVLGSFYENENAEQEQRSLEERFSIKTEIRRSPAGRYWVVHRVSELTMSRAAAMAKDIWTITLPITVLSTLPTISPSTVATNDTVQGADNDRLENDQKATKKLVTEVPVVNDVAPESERLEADVPIVSDVKEYPTILPGQTLVSYCRSLLPVTPEFCEAGRLELIQIRAGSLKRRSEALLEFCAGSNLSLEATEICRNLRR